MKNIFSILAATAAVGLATSAFAADESANAKAKVEYKKNGGYESIRSSGQTDAEGTTTAAKSKVDVDVDANGNVTKKVKAESTTDPKGLMNKEKDTVKSEVKEKENGGYESEETRKHTDAEGTNVTTKAKTDVAVDNAGNVTETTKTEKIVDPKGLMNKETTTTKTKAVNGTVVEQEKKTN